MAKKKETKIIVVMHHKGGVGKTTISVNLAFTYAHLKYKTALVDIDSQGSAKRLARFPDLYSFDDDIEMNKYDLIVIDTPPYLTGKELTALKNADLVIVPTKPNPMDNDTLPDTLELIEKARLGNPKLKSALLISQLDKRNSMWDDMKPYFLRLDISILTCQIENRVSYARSILDDKGIFSQDDKRAQQEMSNLVIEINKILKI